MKSDISDSPNLVALSTRRTSNGVRKFSTYIYYQLGIVRRKSFLKCLSVEIGSKKAYVSSV